MFYSENTNGKTAANKTVKSKDTNLQQKMRHFHSLHNPCHEGKINQ